MSAFLTWFPRILSMAYVLFIASFALDSFSEPGSMLRHLGIFLLHLIPAIAASICLFVAWRRRILGGLLHIVLSMIFTIYFGSWRDTQSFLMISLPLAVAGFLFIVSKWNYQTADSNHPAHL
ncbi:MAG: hypothetical protein IT258_02365 [Saprospiraceae bacterium]|nr:hypothetical protein [Saprospiraceae bacterium]